MCQPPGIVVTASMPLPASPLSPLSVAVKSVSDLPALPSCCSQMRYALSPSSPLMLCPAAPVAPVVPVAPVSPLAPVGPLPPAAPVAPVAPAAPMPPAAPVAPTAAAAAVAPLAPAVPFAPLTPFTPAAPLLARTLSARWTFLSKSRACNERFFTSLDVSVLFFTSLPVMKCFAAAPADGTPTARTPTVAMATALGLLICITPFSLSFEGWSTLLRSSAGSGRPSTKREKCKRRPSSAFPDVRGRALRFPHDPYRTRRPAAASHRCAIAPTTSQGRGESGPRAAPDAAAAPARRPPHRSTTVGGPATSL